MAFREFSNMRCIVSQLNEREREKVEQLCDGITMKGGAWRCEWDLYFVFFPIDACRLTRIAFISLLCMLEQDEFIKLVKMVMLWSL